MTIRSTVKTQFGTLSKKVVDAEKNASKQVRQILKSTEKFRGQQLKKIQSLIKKARELKNHDLLKKAEGVRERIETTATIGMELLMTKLNVPSKKEIERLQKKLAQMQKRLDEMDKARSTKH